MWYKKIVCIVLSMFLVLSGAFAFAQEEYSNQEVISDAEYREIINTNEQKSFATATPLQEMIAPTMYVTADSAGIVSQWDGSLVESIVTDNGVLMHKTADGQGVKWQAWEGSTACSYDWQRQTEIVKFGNSTNANDVLSFVTKPSVNFVKTGSTKMVIGVKSDRDITLELQYGFNWDDPPKNAEAGKAGKLAVKGGDAFREYVIPVSQLPGWDEDGFTKIGGIRFVAAAPVEETNLEFAYIRLADDSYEGLAAGIKPGDHAVENGATGYDKSKQLVDFVFPEALKLETVTEASVKINGLSVRRVTVTAENKKNIRVDLGTLLDGTEYTVSFPGVETESGNAVEGFSFTTFAPLQKQITPTMYQTDDTGIVDGWEGNTVQADLITTSSSGSDVHNSMPIKYDEQQKRTVTWGSWGYIKNSYNAQQQTEHISIEANAANSKDLIVYFTPQLKKDGNTKLVIGARASKDSTFYVHFAAANDAGQAGEWKDWGISLSVTGGDTFREYTIIDASNSNWSNLSNLKNLRIGLSNAYPEARTLDVAYIRVVNASYGVDTQSPINSGAAAYESADNIVDFDFGEALDECTVHPSGITVNGEPVRWAMTLPGNPSRIRVSLGELKNGRTYTVDFFGLMTADAYAVTDSDFTFTTAMPKAVDCDITLHKAAPPAGIVKSWEGTDIASSEVNESGNGSDTNTMKEGSDSHTVKWEDWGNATETWTPEADAERVVVWPNTTASILSYYTNKWEKETATKLVVGIRSSANFTISLYAGASAGALYSTEACSFTTEGNGVFQEYVFHKSDFKGSGWDAQTQFGYLRLDVKNPENTAQTVDIAYVRLVDDTYNGPFGAEGGNIAPEEFGDAFAAKNGYMVDLVFDKEIDLRGISNENFAFNRNAADYVMVDPANPRRIRVSMKTSATTSLTRSSFKVSGLYTMDEAPVNEKVFRFTTAADVQAILGEINRLRVEGTVAELQEMLEENYEWLYLKAEEYERFIAGGERLTELYSVLLGSQAADKNELKYQLDEAAVLLKVRYGNVEEFFSALENYDPYLQFRALPAYATYASLSETAQREVASRLLAAQCDTMEEMRDVFEESVVLVALHRAVTWGEVQSILRTSAKLLAIDLSLADGLKTPSAAYQALTERSFSSLAEVKQAYKNAADAQAAQEKTSGSGGGSGNTGGGNRGSGGGSGAYVALPPQTKPAETTPEQDATIRPAFSDMSGFDWAKPAVESLCIKGIVNGMGDGRFEPAREVRREEFVKMLAVAFELPLTAETQFADIAADDWCAPYVGAAVRAGFVRGMGETFGVGQTLRRQDAAVMAARALHMEESNDIAKFTDSGEISDYARGAVNALAQAGIIQGAEDGSFRPNGVLTRAEAAVILHRMIGGVSE